MLHYEDRASTGATWGADAGHPHSATGMSASTGTRASAPARVRAFGARTASRGRRPARANVRARAGASASASGNDGREGDVSRASDNQGAESAGEGRSCRNLRRVPGMLCKLRRKSRAWSVCFLSPPAPGTVGGAVPGPRTQVGSTSIQISSTPDWLSGMNKNEID